MAMLVLCVLVCHVTAWINQFDEPFTFTCPAETSLIHVVSSHDNYHQDRVWEFSCRAPPHHDAKMINCEWTGYIPGSCYFTPYVNNLNEHMDYVVPGGKVMRGIDSYHDNHKEDRRFKFEICGLVAHDSTILG